MSDFGVLEHKKAEIWGFEGKNGTKMPDLGIFGVKMRNFGVLEVKNVKFGDFGEENGDKNA